MKVQLSLTSESFAEAKLITEMHRKMHGKRLKNVLIESNFPPPPLSWISSAQSKRFDIGDIPYVHRRRQSIYERGGGIAGEFYNAPDGEAGAAQRWGAAILETRSGCPSLHPSDSGIRDAARRQKSQGF